MERLARLRIEEDGSVARRARLVRARTLVAWRIAGTFRRRARWAGEREARAMKTIAHLEAWLINPPVDGPAATLLLRLMAGGVFVWEGIAPRRFMVKTDEFLRELRRMPTFE
jgi:hypothetical protein